MIKLTTDGASLLFKFTDHQHYLYGTGEINVPLNSLTVIFEDATDMVTFRKAPSNDIFLSANINEIEGFDKASLKAWLQSNAYGQAVKDGMSLKVVDELPTVGSEKFIYLKEADGSYEMWVYTSETGWVLSSSLNATSYVGINAINISKLGPTDTATTVSLKIKNDDKFLSQSTSGLTSTIDIKYEKVDSGTVDESGQTIYNHYLRLYGSSSATPVTSIDINDLYKDNYLISASYDDAVQELVLTFKTDNHYSTVRIPITTIVKGENAIKVEKKSGDSAQTISLIIDGTSISGLTQSQSGLKLSADNVLSSASTNVIQNKTVYDALTGINITSASTEDGKVYKLNVLGEEKPLSINVPNPYNATALTVDNQNQYIYLDVKQPDGTTLQLSGNAESVIFENDANNGLEVNNHLLNVKIDSSSDSGLTVSSSGIKFDADATLSSASTNAIENKAVYDALEGINITSAETSTGKTYTLNVNSKAKTEVINVPNPYNATALTVDNQNQYIYLDVKQPDNTTVQLSGNAENIIFESDVNNGLEVNNHNVNVKLENGEKVLTVSQNGVKSNISLSAETSSSNGIVTHTTKLNGIEGQEIASESISFKQGDNISLNLTNDTIELSGKNYTIIESLTGTGKPDILYLYKQTDGTAVTYTQYAYVDNAWIQVSSKGIEYVAGKNIDIYENATTHEMTISGSQVVELTQAEYDALTEKDPDKLYIITDASGLIIYVDALPSTGQKEDTLYLLRKTYASGGTYDEPHTYINDGFSPIDIDYTDIILQAPEY